MNYVYIITLIYIVIINALSSLLAAIDKKRAVKGKWRISEHTLMIIGLFGGAFGEYLTMKAIHHKTKHKKFMIGLPLIFFVHIILIVLLILKAAS